MARRKKAAEPPVTDDGMVTVHHDDLDKTLTVRRSRLTQMDPGWKPAEPQHATPAQDAATDESEE